MAPAGFVYGGLALAALTIGSTTTVVFHVLTPEPAPPSPPPLASQEVEAPIPAAAESELGPSSPLPTSRLRAPAEGASAAAPSAPALSRPIGAWLTTAEFHLCALTYMCTRLLANASQVYLPFLALDALQMGAYSLSAVPMARQLGGNPV